MTKITTQANSYWANEGRHQDLVEQLNELVPDSGECDAKSPALDKFRRASNVYYDVFNNGLCNRGREFYPIFKFGFSQFKRTVRSRRTGRPYQGVDFDAAIAKMDPVIDEIALAAAKEQGITARKRDYLDV